VFGDLLKDVRQKLAKKILAGELFGGTNHVPVRLFGAKCLQEGLQEMGGSDTKRVSRTNLRNHDSRLNKPDFNVHLSNFALSRVLSSSPTIFPFVCGSDR